MARDLTSANVDSKRRHMTDKTRGEGRRGARPAAVRRNAIAGEQLAADPSLTAPAVEAEEARAWRSADCNNGDGDTPTSEPDPERSQSSVVSRPARRR